jgi:hypothetical protein
MGSLTQLVVLDVLLDEGKSLRVFTEVLDGEGGASLDLSSLAFLVVLAMTNPFAKFLSLLNMNEGDVVGLGESLQTRLNQQQGNVLTVTSFSYFGSLQSSASTQMSASLRSTALQTSFKPLTSPIIETIVLESSMPSILVRIRRSVSKHESAPLLTVINLGLFDHTLDGILDIICFSFLNWGGLLEFLSVKKLVAVMIDGAYSSLSDISLNLCVKVLKWM